MYGEEFEIKSYYYDGDMWAMCYPVNDPTLLFQVRTDEHAERIKHDYYLQTVVARQVEEEYGPLVQQAFPGSYLSVDVCAADYEGQTADKVTLDSMLQYNNSSRDDEDDTWTHIVLNIFIDISQMSDENAEKEYAFVQECESIIAEMAWCGSSDIYEKIEECPKSWIGYRENGEVIYTLDEYIEIRTEALNNE